MPQCAVTPFRALLESEEQLPVGEELEIMHNGKKVKVRVVRKTRDELARIVTFAPLNQGRKKRYVVEMI